MNMAPVAKLILAANRLGLDRQVVAWSTTDTAPDEQFVMLKFGPDDLARLAELSSPFTPGQADRYLPGQLELF